MTKPNNLLLLAERLAFALSSARVRECYQGIKSGSWERRGNEWCRLKPYPMGVYDNDPNLYYASGWGCHVKMLPHERWLVRRAARLRALAQGGPDVLPT